MAEAENVQYRPVAIERTSMAFAIIITSSAMILLSVYSIVLGIQVKKILMSKKTLRAVGYTGFTHG